MRTNADLPDQAAEAIAFGAEGIGLCRTEHMFFDHIAEMREMIMAETTAAREAALAKMLPFQRADFAGLFKAMAGRPVTIRLLDPPLHEFLPQDKAGREEMARVLGKSAEAVVRRVEELHESNPMLGHRGCRLGIVYPEITAMQARAIFEAAVQVKKEGVTVHPEVMIPLVGFRKELQNQEKIVRDDGGQGVRRDGRDGGVPGRHDDRGAAGLRWSADEIAKTAEFFSFGTNDLTQTTLGVSRDDYGPFISVYTDPKKADVLPADPFATIDQEGVGALMKMAVEKGRAARPG